MDNTSYNLKLSNINNLQHNEETKNIMKNDVDKLLKKKQMI